VGARGVRDRPETDGEVADGAESAWAATSLLLHANLMPCQHR